AREVDVPLGLLEKGRRYQMTVYRDADNADWKANPEAFTIEKRVVTSGDRLKVKLAPGGGAAVSMVAM
ncbi:MAG TPA: glycoside hydrolase family 97 C-terminal domain-containing protein, partial [Puia sp.]|nr:glycoside hydrolase family 97 C-terminal domain-containing protein [Puia sp.]